MQKYLLKLYCTQNFSYLLEQRIWMWAGYTLLPFDGSDLDTQRKLPSADHSDSDEISIATDSCITIE